MAVSVGGGDIAVLRRLTANAIGRSPGHTADELRNAESSITGNAVDGRGHIVVHDRTAPIGGSRRRQEALSLVWRKTEGYREPAQRV